MKNITTKIEEFILENLNGNINNLKELYTKNGFSENDIYELSEEGYFDNIEWFDDNTLVIYRSLSLPESKVDNFMNSLDKGIGRYWSFNKNIESIWGGNAEYEAERGEEIIDIRCKGHLKLSDIDFDDLLYAYNDDFHNFSDEKEIRGKNIKVIECK